MTVNKAAVRRTPKDRFDLSNLEAMLALPGYDMVQERIRTWIAQLDVRLRSCTAAELPLIQHEIGVLEKVLRIPETIAKEVQTRCKAA